MLITPDVKDEIYEELIDSVVDERGHGIIIRYLEIAAVKYEQCAEYSVREIDLEYAIDFEEFLDICAEKHNDSKDNYFYTFILDWGQVV